MGGQWKWASKRCLRPTKDCQPSQPLRIFRTGCTACITEDAPHHHAVNTWVDGMAVLLNSSVPTDRRLVLTGVLRWYSFRCGPKRSFAWPNWHVPFHEDWVEFERTAKIESQ